MTEEGARSFVDLSIGERSCDDKLVGESDSGSDGVDICAGHNIDNAGVRAHHARPL